MSTRQLVSSGSPFEPEIGFSRAVRIGAHVAVSGTAPIAAGGGIACPGDAYGQTHRCLEIIEAAVRQAGAAVNGGLRPPVGLAPRRQAGASLKGVSRTRVMLAGSADRRESARAHGGVFGSIRPASTFVYVA